MGKRVVSMMLPMTIRCNTCRHNTHKLTKFTSRQEDVIGETYLGVEIFRYYIKCSNCSAEITMKGDPENNRYVVESGGTSREHEPLDDEAL